MKLVCAVVGVEGSAFPVDIEEGQSVGELKDAIKVKKRNDLKDVDTKKLQLFLAKMWDDQCLSDEHDAAQGLEEEIIHEDIQTLINGEKIKPTKSVKYWISEKNKMPPPPTTDHIHVLVTVPEQSASARIASPAGVFDHCSDPFFSQFPTAHQVEGWLEFSSLLKLTRHQKIYIRSSYKVIADQVLLNPDVSMVKYAVVTATPGVGKSVFVYYVMWRLVKDKKRVLFFSKKGPLYFNGSTMFQCRVLPNTFDVQFWSPELWYLVDSVDPTRMKELPIEECSVLLASTPRQDCIAEFVKLVPKPEVFYMPL